MQPDLLSREETNEPENQDVITVEPTPLSSKIVRSVFFGGLRYLLIAPIPLIMTPLIIRKIGVAGYGTWAVFLAINGLTSLADLGLVGTLSKFVADYHARRDFPSLGRLLNSGLTLFLLLDAVIAAVLWSIAPLLVNKLFQGTTISPRDVIFLFRCFLIVIAANVLTQLFASVTTGLQRLDLTNIMSTVNVVLSAFLGGILLVRGGGLRGLVYGYIGSAFVTVFLYLMLVKRLLPQVALRLWQFDRWEAKKMFGYSLRLYVTQAAVAVHNQIEKVFLAMFVGVAPAGLYDISSDIALKIRGSMGMILTPVLPAASELNALSDESRMRELYYRSHKYLALIGVPVVCYVISVSSRFAELWLGGSMITIALPLSILLLANFLNLVTGPGFFIFAGSGYMKPGIQSAMLGLTLNVVLSLGLIYKFGFAGAVAGTFTSLVIASGYFMWMFHQHTGYSILRVLRESYLKPICSSIVILALLLAIHPARDLSWIGLAVMGVAFGSLYGITILYSRFFDEYDWMKIGDALPLARQARRIFRFA